MTTNGGERDDYTPEELEELRKQSMVEAMKRTREMLRRVRGKSKLKGDAA